MKTTILTTVLLILTATCVLAAEPKKPATTQAAQSFTSPADVVKVVPKDLLPTQAKDWTDLRIDAINDVLHQKAEGQPGQFSVTVAKVESKKDAAEGKRLAITGKTLAVGQVKVWNWYWFDDNQKAALATIKPDQPLTIKGRIQSVHFKRDGSTVVLAFNFDRCELVPTK